MVRLPLSSPSQWDIYSEVQISNPLRRCCPRILRAMSRHSLFAYLIDWAMFSPMPLPDIFVAGTQLNNEMFLEDAGYVLMVVHVESCRQCSEALAGLHCFAMRARSESDGALHNVVSLCLAFDMRPCSSLCRVAFVSWVTASTKVFLSFDKLKRIRLPETLLRQSALKLLNVFLERYSHLRS